jgi:short-subunit dehydrogenase
VPAQTAYCASKYAVVGLSEVLRGEGALHGVGVSVVCPSIVTTNIPQSVRWRMTTDRCPTERHMTDRSEALSRWRDHSPDSVAERVVRAVEKNKGIVRVGAESYVQDYSHRVIPAAFRLWQVLALRLIKRAF